MNESQSYRTRPHAPIGKLIEHTRGADPALFKIAQSRKISRHEGIVQGLGNRREVTGELLFLDDQVMLFSQFDQIQVSKSLHEDADPRSGCTDHRGEFFV